MQASVIAYPRSYPVPLTKSRHLDRRVESSASSESALVAAASGGDERAFRRIVETYVDDVSRTVTGMLGPGPDIDDVVQNVFIKLHRSLHSFRGDSSLKTYITRMAINQSLDALRKRKRSRWMQPWISEDVYDPPASERSDADLAAAEQSRILREAVDRLPENQRVVVVLRLIEECSTEETARILNIPFGTVLSRLKRGVDRLKNDLGDSFTPN